MPDRVPRQCLAFGACGPGIGPSTILVTNAHPKSLAVKDARLDLTAELDAHYSAHTFGYPKQYEKFWSALSACDPYDPSRTLFVDDDVAVLGAARESGIEQLLCVAQPDSRAPKRSALPFPALDDFEEVMTF